MQAKDNARRVMVALREDAARLRTDAKRQLGEAWNRYSATVAVLKQRIRDARSLYGDERRAIHDHLKHARLSAAQRIAHEREQVSAARARVNTHITSGQRMAGQRLNETFHEAMYAAANTIGSEHPELIPSFNKWRNTGLARRAFSRGMKLVRGQHKNRTPRPDEIGDAVAVEWLEKHIESFDDHIQHVNDSIEKCVERAEKKISRLTITDPHEYEQEAARIWNECRG